MAISDKTPSTRVLWRQEAATDARLFADIALVRAPEPAYPADAGDPERACYHDVLVADPAAAELLCARLQAAAGVDAVAVSQRPVVETRGARAESQQVPAEVVEGDTPDYFGLQRHLEPAPVGVDAFAAWDRPGGLGDGVRIVAVENAWNFLHEDLRSSADPIGIVTGDLIYGDSEDDRDHGTAVLGLLRATPNGRGTCGLAPNAVLRTASPTYGDGAGVHAFSLDTALRALAVMLEPGDVVLIELHYQYPEPDGPELLPVSIKAAERAAIRELVRRGIYVIEPAGNGGLSLDDPRFDGVFSRDEDTGSIMVGAGQSPIRALPRAPIASSNFGSRVDVQGWGEDVITTGGRSHPDYCDLRDHPDPSRCYTQTFGGTSSASAIVAGVVAIISGMVRAAGRPPLSPHEMRARLVAGGTPQAEPDRWIGPLPDLARIVAELEL
jgi:subtilisin family serine protease